jgi:fatty acid desaturase
MTDEQQRKREEQERLEAEQRSEADRRDFKQEGVVWWTITGIFVILWALGLATGTGRAIHLLLLIVLILVVERWGQSG